MPIVKPKNPKKKVACWADKERRFCLPKGVAYDANFLPVIQNLHALGYPDADIGMILGYLGDDKQCREFIRNMRRRHEDADLAMQVGKQMANAYLVAQMYKSAVGYNWDEEEINYVNKEKVGDNGTEVVEVQTGRKVKKKHYTGSPNLAMFLAVNRMPESFTNRLEIAKKTIDLTGEIPAEAMKKIANKLVEFAEGKKLRK